MTKVSTERPSAVHRWTARAVARRSAGDIDGALGAIEHALALDPESAWAWAERGLAHAQAGDRDAAIAALERALQIDPTGGPPGVRVLSALERLRG